MGLVRALKNPAKCMQRLGFLKLLAQVCSRAATSNLANVGKTVVGSLRQKVPVSVDLRVHDYVMRALTQPPNLQLRRRTQEIFDSGLETPVSLEIQDAYLALGELPSKRGKLFEDDWKKFPRFATNLGLVRPETFSLLVRGKSLLALVSDEELHAFAALSEHNPFLLTPEDKLLFLYSLVEADGDILRLLYPRLMELSAPFNLREAGDLMPDVLKTLAANSRPAATGYDDLARLQQLLDTAERINALRGRSHSGGRGVRADNIVPRLEPLVDLELVSKPNAYDYRYETNQAFWKFFGPLAECDRVETFLEGSFFSAANECWGIRAAHKSTLDSLLPWLWRAYGDLKSPLGYATIREVALLAGIRAMVDGGLYFEITEAIQTLKDLQKEEPGLVRFNVDRLGKLSVVKFIGKPTANGTT